MSQRSYRKPGLVLRRHSPGTVAQVKDLQHDVRALGYLHSGIDGAFGRGTDGVLDQKLAAVIVEILNDEEFAKLPSSDDAKAENVKIQRELAALRSKKVPIPFLRAMFRQESGGRHFRVPTARNSDSFIVVGLDTNAGEKHIITSRGDGVGQYTLFHHPPHLSEVGDFMLDVKKNIAKAVAELREKFDHFVNGPSTGTQADDRLAEIGAGPLEVCKFERGDPRFLTECKQCLIDAGKRDIQSGVTRWFAGSNHRYAPTRYYRSADYTGVPVRKKIGCDWPYAMRRYNGSGTNSYHYQARVLRFLLKQSD